MNQQVGIESVGLYVPRYALRLADLAVARGVDADKYRLGIGQDEMGVPAPDEDVVTMGANAARQALEDVDLASIDTLMFATESGVDQSKAAAIYVHRLLGLPANCKSFEIKQACCGSTAALQMALAFAAQKPNKKVLVIASDVARYGLGAAGEPTQGAGAIAMVISSQPRLLSMDLDWGSYTEDVMDFWRPNYLDEALVDGKFSIKVYLRALAASWRQYAEETGRRFEDHAHFCYHLPFTRMAEKAHTHLASLNRVVADHTQLRPALMYNRRIGNSYTASLYIGLISLLENSDALVAGQRIGLFSYGSGCMAAYFSGVLVPGFERHVHRRRAKTLLDDREWLTVQEYEDFYRHEIPRDGTHYTTPHYQTGEFRLAGVEQHKRLYEKSRVAVMQPAMMAC